MDYYAIGQRIRKIRRSRGLSQEQLSEMVGISVTHMSHIETGNTKVSLEVFAAIVTALEARSDEILFDITPAVRSAAQDEIAALLEECSGKELCIVSDIIRAVKASIDKYK